jgi:hypothetical protein
MEKVNKYYTTKGRIDGFGCQYQSIMSGIAISEYRNYNYIHTPFVTMEHDVDVDKLNEFIGIPITDISNILIENMIHEKYSDEVNYASRPSIYYTNSVIKKIKGWYYNTKKPEIDKIDVAIHIRRGDVSENGTHRERFISNDTYLKVINSLKIKYPNYNIHIYSEGNLDDFKEINIDGITFHLNEDIMKTFHSFVTAKILVLSISSFSYAAAIINSNTVYYYDFWHKPLDNWLNFEELSGIPIKKEPDFLTFRNQLINFTPLRIQNADEVGNYE